ncbi:hypothetical protein CN448_18680 [Bacillus cereus]|uniref:hypothetical protein n=1 Tax=Bacillus cereus TaxID=1396 RepID=UPI000BF3963F|nr:hypothetical protein [Bacillus cereus]PEW66957.1 hypothetical protein CN448_18680 [Bacillus cereus]
MGYLLNKAIPSGLKINGAYARVASFSGTKEYVDFSIAYYVSRENFLGNVPCFYQENFRFIPDLKDSAPNVIKQSYLYSKTLDAFKDAIDVFEEDQV